MRRQRVHWRSNWTRTNRIEGRSHNLNRFDRGNVAYGYLPRKRSRQINVSMEEPIATITRRRYWWWLTSQLTRVRGEHGDFWTGLAAPDIPYGFRTNYPLSWYLIDYLVGGTGIEPVTPAV